MEKLAVKEEEVMQILWEIGKGLVSDVISRLPDPKPPHSTISSVVRRLERKGFVGHKAYGKTYEYFPLVSKGDYKKRTFREMLHNYFDNSFGNVVSFIAKEEKLSNEDIKELEKLIQRNAQRKRTGNE
ncbi:MAG: BlaI/MecI/CopY family transcriptional regulator [Bacteroidales bacterium]|nr:MAG: BlaI/MecI/CopY family transcriptional regulator [Bacteroidales bacterium]